MTGLTAAHLVDSSDFRLQYAAAYFPGVELLDPVREENVKPSAKIVKASDRMLRKYWARDKELIRRAHVLIDISGPEKSEGVAHEIGYARYYLHKPVIRVYQGLGASVARIEADAIAQDFVGALRIAEQRWGTPWKRLKWKLALFARCFPGYILTRVRELGDWL